MKCFLMTTVLSIIILVIHGQESLPNSQENPKQERNKKYNSLFKKEKSIVNNSIYRFPKKSFRFETPSIKNQKTIKHQLDSIVVKEWNVISNQWVYISRENYDYDEIGNMLLSLTQDYNYNQWQNIWKGKYTYDTNNNMTSIIYFDWNNSTFQWQEGYKEEFIYNSFGNVS